MCDTNNDGTIDECESFDCVVEIENSWRSTYCPDYGFAYCDCPFTVRECDIMTWNCVDIMYNTEAAWVSWNLNGDDVIDW